MDVTIIGVPYQNDVARWGDALGPRAFLDAGLEQRLREQGHNVLDPGWIELPRMERTRDTVTNLGRIAGRTATAVAEALRRPSGFALVLEGNCTHAVGAIGGVAQALGRPGVVWIDAHSDLNTMVTTTSGLWGGMPYAVALGWDPRRLAPRSGTGAAPIAGSGGADRRQRPGPGRDRSNRVPRHPHPESAGVLAPPRRRARTGSRKMRALPGHLPREQSKLSSASPR